MANFCLNCGAKLTGSGRFCTGCGLPLDAPAASQQDAQPIKDPAQVAAAAPASQNLNHSPAPNPLHAQVYRKPAEPIPPHPQMSGQPAPYQQQEYQQQGNLQIATKKKKRIPLVLKIILSIILGIAVLVTGVVIVGKVAMGNAEKADYYEIGGEEVPSVKLILGETRKVTGVSKSTENGIRKYSVEYEVAEGEGDPGAEMMEYLFYLRDKESFIFLTEHDFDKPTGSGIQLANEASEVGYLVIVQADYDQEGYTVTAMYGEGTLTRYDDEPAEPTNAAAPDSNAAESSTVSSEESSAPPSSTSSTASSSSSSGLGSGLGSNLESIFGTTSPSDADLLRWMESGTYYFEFIQFIGGQEIGSGMIALENSVRGVFIFPDGQGNIMRVFMEDGAGYVVDEENEMIYRMEGLTKDDFSPKIHPGTEASATGQAEINGRTLPYEDYLDEGRIFYENGQVYAFGSSESEDYFVITKQSERAPAGIFDMPDYQIIDVSEQVSAVAGG